MHQLINVFFNISLYLFCQSSCVAKWAGTFNLPVSTSQILGGQIGATRPRLIFISLFIYVYVCLCRYVHICVSTHRG